MFTWMIQIFIISILFISLVHHLIYFLKNTLTVPKITDLVSCSTKKYDNIFSLINNEEDLASTNTVCMKDELKNFLKNQINETFTDTTDIDSLSYL